MINDEDMTNIFLRILLFQNLQKRPAESDMNEHRVIRVTLIQNYTSYTYFVDFI